MTERTEAPQEVVEMLRAELQAEKAAAEKSEVDR